VSFGNVYFSSEFIVALRVTDDGLVVVDYEEGIYIQNEIVLVSN
jgi:translation elongation factor EF-G